MLRRLFSAIAIAAAAALAPAGAAHADTDYSEFPCVITFESQTVTVGEPFDLTVSCTDLASTTVTVQTTFAGQAAGAGSDVDVAGTDSVELVLDEDGTATASETVSAPGDYTEQVFAADGTPLSETYTLTAVAAGAGDAPGDDGNLAATGSTSLPYLAAAGALLLVGVTTLVVTRVRARRQH